MRYGSSTSEPRRDRGVYKTPRPVVGYVVRSVDRLLRSKLGRPEGLLDRNIRVLDPAAGPMNFLRAAWWQAIVSHRHRGGDVAELVRSHLLPHFQGYELLADTYTRGDRAARRFLARIGSPIAPEEFPTLLLTDSLAPPAELLDEPFTVILGNPPWRGRSKNQGPWITDLLRGYLLPDGRQDGGYFRVDGEPLGERNSKWLHDDGVKFLRLAQWKIDQGGEGIVAFVVNHNGLDAPTFRGLRRSLLQTFDQIYALDLHGNGRKCERAPDGSRDENVFPGVAQGAALLFLVKRPGLPKRVFRADLFGRRREKLQALARSDIETTRWTEIGPRSPGYLFLQGDRELEREYARGLALPEIFPVSSVGIVTGRDALVTDLDRGALEGRLVRFRSTPPSEQAFEDLRSDPAWRRKLGPFLARPFDLRHLFYADYLLKRPRKAVMSHLLSGGNVGLVVPRQGKEEPGALVTRWIVGHKAVSAYDVNSVFPLYLDSESDRLPNLAPGLQTRLAELYDEAPTPEAVFSYVYALLYSPPYRRRYRELLQRDFPRISFPEDGRAFLDLARLGSELVGLHLLEDPRLLESRVELAGDARRPLSTKPHLLRAYSEPDRRIALNEHGLAFQALEPEVWSYRVGGYPVLGQWLQARAGRVLRWEEVRAFRRTAEALRLTIGIESKIERVYQRAFDR